MCGYDAHKKTRGRKRVLIVDVRGSVLECRVVSASTPEREALMELLSEQVRGEHESWEYILMDSGFDGEPLAQWLWNKRGLEGVVVNKSAEWATKWEGDEKFKGFVPLKWRWVIERTFAWLSRYRRLAEDLEHSTTHSKTMIHLAMTHILLSRLFPAA